MKRAIYAFLTTTVTALGLICAQAEPMLKAHFAGIDNLIKRDDAKTLRSVWALKQTQAFRNEVLDKLAKRMGGDNAQREATLRKLLPDLGRGELFLDVAPNRGPTGRRAHHGAGQKTRRALGQEPSATGQAARRRAA